MVSVPGPSTKIPKGPASIIIPSKSTRKSSIAVCRLLFAAKHSSQARSGSSPSTTVLSLLFKHINLELLSSPDGLPSPPLPSFPELAPFAPSSAPCASVARALRAGDDQLLYHH